MTHCDNCGGRLGMVVRRKWSWRFCKPTCKTAFEYRQHEEVRHRMRALFLKLPGFLGSGTCAATEYAATISAKSKFLLSVLSVLGTASAGFAMAQSPAQRHSTPVSQSQHQVIGYGSERVSADLHLNPHESTVYFEPTPAPFNAYTYSASAPLVASGSKRTLQGEFRFPVFTATPNVSVQIISSISAVPTQVRAVKISEMVGQSGATETQVIVEAEPIFDVPAGGVYFANLVVTGVPVSPPTASSHTQLLPLTDAFRARPVDQLQREAGHVNAPAR
jgi:hypothetical protein